MNIFLSYSNILNIIQDPLLVLPGAVFGAKSPTVIRTDVEALDTGPCVLDISDGSAPTVGTGLW